MAIDAPRWVLVPGTLCNGAVFHPLMQALGVAEARRVVLPQDLPDVAAWRARLVATVRPGDIVCGFSLGAIAVAHAADALPHAAALVLIALNPRPDPPDKRSGRDALRHAAQSGALKATFADAAPGLFARPTPALTTAVTRMAQAEASHIDAQTALALGRPGAIDPLQRAQVPALFVTGAEDRQAQPDLAREAAAAPAKAALRLVPGLGHFCLLEDPAAVAGAIREGLGNLGVPAC